MGASALGNVDHIKNLASGRVEGEINRVDTQTIDTRFDVRRDDVFQPILGDIATSGYNLHRFRVGTCLSSSITPYTIVPPAEFANEETSLLISTYALVTPLQCVAPLVLQVQVLGNPGGDEIRNVRFGPLPWRSHIPLRSIRWANTHVSSNGCQRFAASITLVSLLYCGMGPEMIQKRSVPSHPQFAGSQRYNRGNTNHERSDRKTFFKRGISS